MMSERTELFTRYEKNPILTPERWPCKVARVFNPGATLFQGQTLLLVRVQDRKGHSHLTVVKSKDGKTNWRISKRPSLLADSSYGEHQRGLEDPRIVYFGDKNIYIITCVSFRTMYPGNPNAISLLTTENFNTFERKAIPLLPGNKNGSLFPELIGGYYVLINRPYVDGGTCISVSFSKDLKFWGKDKPLLSPRPEYWDDYKVGLGAQPIKTRDGWLILYHASTDIASKIVYRVGLALLDLRTLEVIRRSEEWIMAPRMDYEGGPDGIVFPCGVIVDEQTRELRLYYGANDYYVGLATANLDEVLGYLMTCPEK